MDELSRILSEVRTQMTNTVISYPERDPRGRKWGNPKYNGNCSGKVPLGFIDKLGAKSVAELFAGSGTLSDVCRDYNIPYTGVDLHPFRDNIVAMDITDMNADLPKGFYEADMVFSHPPYPSINNIRYSNKEWVDTDGTLTKRDIQNMSFEEGMKMINLSTMRAYTALPAGSYIVLLVGEIRSQGNYYSMYNNLVIPGGKLYQTYVKIQHNTTSGYNTYIGKSTRALTAHEMIAVIKKPSGYEISYILPTKYSLDIRDSIGTATWMDVVTAVMRELKSANLEQIYKEIESHQKAKSSNTWKSKVRQTLQKMRDRGMTVNTARGYWSIAA